MFRGRIERINGLNRYTLEKTSADPNKFSGEAVVYSVLKQIWT